MPGTSSPRYSTAMACSFAIVLAAVASGTGCITYQRSSTTTHTVTSATPPPPSTPDLVLAPSIVGLFIGVSNYDPEARVYSTPAHTLSAAQLYDTFYHADEQAAQVALYQQLKLPVPCCIARHKGEVVAIAFSADGSHVASASSDGTIAWWNADGGGEPLVFRYRPEADVVAEKGAVRTLAISPGGSAIAFLTEDGKATVWQLQNPDAPRVLADSNCVVNSLVYRADGRQILTTCVDGGVRLWNGDGQGEPTRVPPAEGCTVSAPAAFSPSGERIVTAGCGRIRVLASNGPAGPYLVTRDAGDVRAVTFSPNGAKIVTSGPIGSRVWSSDRASDPVPVGKAGQPTERAIFTADGSRIAILRGNGDIDVWPSDLNGEPVTIYGSRRSQAIELSSDGDYMLTVESGSALLASTRTKGEILLAEPPARYCSKGKRSLRSAAFSPDGKRIVTGYSDGTVALVPGRDGLDVAAARRENFDIVAGLRMSPADPNARLIVHRLVGMSSLSRSVHAPFGWNLPDNLGIDSEREFPLPKNEPPITFDDGKPVTKATFFAALSQSLRRVADEVRAGGRVVLVIYVSAHGLIGKDGRAAILPADARADNPASWIPYAELLQPVYSLVESQNRGRSGEGASVNAIVILDTCQNQSVPGRAAESANYSRPAVVVVEGTAPGRYAWHWQQVDRKVGNTTVQHDLRLGFPLPPKSVPHGVIDTTMSLGLSILPVASQYALKSISKPGQDITLRGWLKGTSQMVATLQEEIPEVKESGIRQEVQLHIDPAQYDFRLFYVEGIAR